MGYTKKTADRVFRITQSFEVHNKDLGTIERCEVTHVFRAPTVAERERHDREAMRQKGKRIRLERVTANWNLWRACVLDAIGYDDLDAEFRGDDGKLHGEWHNYFQSDVERIHVDSMTDELNLRIEGEDVVLEKKLEPSSEPSSDTATTATPTATTKSK